MASYGGRLKAKSVQASSLRTIWPSSNSRGQTQAPWYTPRWSAIVDVNSARVRTVALCSCSGGWWRGMSHAEAQTREESFGLNDDPRRHSGNDEGAAGGWRPLWTPDQALEPQNAPLHLWRAQWH